MDDDLTFIASPGNFGAAASWVIDRIEERERQRYFGGETMATWRADETPSLHKVLPPIQRLFMGYSVFAEALACHSRFSLWAVDYCDGRGPRVRLGSVIAEPREDMHPWEIRLE